ncbi:von Hippel-Lindau tumor suppressor homolog isoform X1 [Harpegnathos saltator]|uniref:von Hippel-Lindau disease tumor suppressor n=1 Tax=Harpegnathos saltator TaxID=610380 RepID=E2B9A0_HARSA|nr:von Hippel-Lindau tumor suppressor homolog isoform X1 [Harpegnathos saltator]EFN87748.1 Von Hippel-Lindau disease tumor suppressor [Harpegnathos saltator]
MDEDQESLLRSISNQHRSFVKFINQTFRPVRLYWIDYQGNAVNYGDLSPGDYIDINTFATHPWIFVDKETGCRYRVNRKQVFFPEPWFKYHDVNNRLSNDGLPLRVQRTNVYITLAVCTLRELSLRAIKKCLRYDRQAFLLDIPRSLQYELAMMLRSTDEAEYLFP